MSEVFLIGTHVTKLEHSLNLYRLCSKLKNLGIDFFISSHTKIPDDLITQSCGYFYGKENKVIPYWDLPSKGLFNYTSHFFQIKSNYIGYGSILNFYGLASFSLFRMGMDFLKRSDYDIIHWIESDLEYNLDLEKKILSILETSDSVFLTEGNSVAGARFSFIKSAFNNSILEKTDDDILRDLVKCNFYTETWVYYNIISGSKTCLDIDINALNKNNQGDRIDFEWCLFENENFLSIFLYNRKQENNKIKFNIDKFPQIEFDLGSKEWGIREILPIGKYSRLEIESEFSQKRVFNLEGENYTKLVKNTEINFF